jgi:hypothetical protein
MLLYPKALRLRNNATWLIASHSFRLNPLAILYGSCMLNRRTPVLGATPMDGLDKAGAEAGFWAETWKALGQSVAVSFLVRAIRWLWRAVSRRKREPSKDTTPLGSDANGLGSPGIIVVLERWKPSRNGATPIAIGLDKNDVKPDSNMAFCFPPCWCGQWVVFQSADKSRTWRYQLPDDPAAGPFIARPPKGNRHG